MAVNPESTLVRWLSLPEQKVEQLDLRLAKGLDPNSHFIQQKQVSIVPADKQFKTVNEGGEWRVCGYR